MVTTMKSRKSFAVTVLVAILLSMLIMFATPFVAHAASGIPTATIDDKGNLTVKGGSFETSTSGTTMWTTILDKYRFFIVGVSGIGAITMVVLFIMQFLKLGASAGNPTARSQALVGVLWTGVAAAGLGSVSMVVGLFYHGLA